MIRRQDIPVHLKATVQKAMQAWSSATSDVLKREGDIIGLAFNSEADRQRLVLTLAKI